MFKGYIKTNGKKPVEKVKDNDKLYTYDYISRQNCDYGGVLNDDVIMVDIDNGEEAEILKKLVLGENITCPIIKTTRGYHFYFKNTDVSNNKIDIKTPIGLSGDFKLGSKHTVVPLRIAGETRRFIQNCEVDEMEYLPFWLVPMKRGKNMVNSSTRNNDLFTYILTLQTTGFNQREMKEIIRLINTYVLKEPLSCKELDTILRDESFSKPCFFIDAVFQHHAFAKWLIKEFSIKKIDAVLSFWDRSKGEYSPCMDYLERKMIDEIASIKFSQRRETLSYITAFMVANESACDPKYLGVGNGVLDIATGELLGDSSERNITNKICCDYVPGCTSELVDRIFLKMACGDTALRDLFFEIIGYCLYRRNELGKFFILVGEGGGGKSTFLDMLSAVIGDRNISNVSLHKLGEKFANTGVVGKLVNVGDDIGDAYIEDDEDLKKMVTGNSIQFQEKGGKPFYYKVFTKFIFSANELPRFKDNSGGLMRRVVIVPFKANFLAGDDYDPYIIDKLTDVNSRRYMLYKGAEGLKRVLERKGFTKVEQATKEHQAYEEYNNSALAFINEVGEADIKNQLCRDVYLRYGVWCGENGNKPVNQNKFGREIKKRLDLTYKSVRIGDKISKLYA